MLHTPTPPTTEQTYEKRPSLIIKLFRWVLQFALMVGLILGALAFMSRSMDQKSEPVSRGFTRSPLMVQAETVAFTDNRPRFTSYGRIVAANQLDVKSAVVGRVLWLSPNMQVGKEVAKGEELIRIDDFTYISNVAEAEAEIAQTQAALSEAQLRLASEKTQLAGAESQLQIAQSDLARTQQLVEQGAATRKQVEERELLVSQRQLAVQQRQNNIEIEGARQAQQVASLKRLELRLERAKRSLSDTIIKSPIEGRVSLVSVEAGQEISTQNTLARLDKTDTLNVDFTLTDAQFGRLLLDDTPLIGKNVEVKWVVGRKESRFDATISRLGAEINAELGGVQIFATLDDPEAIQSVRPGAFVEINVPDRNYPQSVSLPETSIYDGDTVYRISENGRLIATPVNVVAYSDGQAIIESGLEAGQRILSSRLSRITGRPVSIIGDPQNANDRPAKGTQGRPSPDLIAKVKAKNNLTDEQWQAKSRDERRSLINAFRKQGDQ